MISLTQDDRDRVAIFKERVQVLRRSRLLNRGSVTFTVSRGLAGTPDPSQPFQGHDDEEFRSFLQTFRQFQLEREPVNFRRICNLVERHCTNDDLKAWMRHARAFWNTIWKQNPLSYRLNGKTITVEEAFKLLLYGEITHADVEKWRLLTSIPAGARATLYWIVQRSLGDLFRCLHVLDSVIYHWLDEPGHEIPKLDESEVSA